jgi:hypothetical protein
MSGATSGPSNRAIILAGVLGALILLVWALLLSTLVSLGDSDAAGNGLAEAFAGFEIIVLWVLLAGFLVVTGVNGAMPWPGIAAAVVLLPASGFAAMVALGLLADHTTPPFFWPIVMLVVVPPVVLAFGLWALVPRLRAVIPAAVATGATWGIALLLCLAMWPLAQMRDVAVQHDVDAQAKWATDFAALPANAPLWEWTAFLQTPNDMRVADVLKRIGTLDRRQADAEVMLDRGDFPLRYLGFMGIEPTPAICDKARGLLRRQVAPLVLKTANSRPYTDIAVEVEAAVSAMRWLVAHGCPCDAEAAAWEAMANGYRDTNFDVVELRELHDPATPGRLQHSP